MTQEKARIAEIEQAIARYSSLISTSVVIAVAASMALLYFAVSTAASFAWGFLALLPLIFIISNLSGRHRSFRHLLQIRRDWGESTVVGNRDFKAIRLLFDHVSSRDKGDNYIDEQTWKDLNMDLLYTRIDRTYTDPGQSVLYAMLREPLFNKVKLEERSRVISFFKDNREAREKIQLVLIRLGHQYVPNDLFTLLWKDEFARSRISPVFAIMAIAAAINA